MTVRELQGQLAVGTHRELVDRRRLQPRQPRLGQVDLAQQGERQREHHVVGDPAGRRRTRPGDQGPGAVRVADQCGEGRPELDLLRQQRCEAGRDLLVAAADVVLLVARAEDAQLPLTREGQQIEHVQRALRRALRAVLDRVGDVEQLTQPRGRTTGHVRRDPVADRHPVQLQTARRVAGVEGRVARSRHVRVQLLPDGLDVAGGLGVGVERTVEPVDRLGAGRLRRQQVVQREPEGLRELPDGGVPLVDQLTAVLGDLTLVEVPGDRPAAATDAVRRLDHRRAVARLTQLVGRAEAGQPGTDDDDPRTARDGRCRGGGSGARQPTCAQREDTGAAQHLTARRDAQRRGTRILCLG